MSRDGTITVAVPPNYPCATFFVDESSAKESSGQFFVVAGVKTRRPGTLLRNVRDTLDRYGGTSEMKFSRITRARLPLYHQVIDQLRASDAHLTACVVDATRGDIENPFKGDDADWVVHARITAKMLGCSCCHHGSAGGNVEDVARASGS